MTTSLEPTELDFPRDRWSRPLIGADRVPYQRPSQLGNCIDDTYNLELHQKRQVAQGLATAHDVYASAVALEVLDTKENKKAWNGIVELAQDAMRSDARARLGTALHKMTERVDGGEEVDLPPVFAADIAAYRKAMEMSGLTVVPGMIECRCVCDEVTAAGTFDRIVQDNSGTTYIADVKTGKTADYPHGFAVQLAVYANAELYDLATCARTPLPDTLNRSRGVIIHLPAGEARCEIHWIDLDAGWEAAKVAHWVRQTWQKNKRLLSNIISISEPADEAPPAEPPVTTHGNDYSAEPAQRVVTAAQPTSWLRAEQLRARIAKLTAAQQAELRAEWPKGISLKREITRDESATVAELVARYEGSLERVAESPDEGRDVDRSTIANLEQRFGTLDEVGQAWVMDLNDDATRAGGGFRLSGDYGRPTLRRFELVRALVFLARHGLTERLPDLIASTLGDVPGSPGALLASMGVHDAARFAQLVDALAVRSVDDEADEPPRLMPVA